MSNVEVSFKYVDFGITNEGSMIISINHSFKCLVSSSVKANCLLVLVIVVGKECKSPMFDVGDDGNDGEVVDVRDCHRLTLSSTYPELYLKSLLLAWFLKRKLFKQISMSPLTLDWKFMIMMKKHSSSIIRNIKQIFT